MAELGDAGQHDCIIDISGEIYRPPPPHPPPPIRVLLGRSCHIGGMIKSGGVLDLVEFSFQVHQGSNKSKLTESFKF